MLLFTLLIVAYCYFFFIREDPYLSQAEKIVNKILAESTQIIEKKFGLVAVGDGASMPNNEVRKLTLVFDTKKTKAKEELRILLIYCAHELLDRINRDEELQQYMVEVPFTIKNVQIVIFNRDENGYIAQDPIVSVADIVQGILSYKSNDSLDSYKYKTDVIEAYPEALQSIQLANQSNME